MKRKYILKLLEAFVYTLFRELQFQMVNYSSKKKGKKKKIF